MTTLPDLARRALGAYALSILLLLALAACGPGTGGTGTGPVTGGTGTGPVTGVFGYGGPGFSAGAPCVDDCQSASLVLENDRVEFTAPCQRFIYIGPWELDEQGVVVLEGTLETTDVVNGQSQTTRSHAVMRLQFNDAAANSREVALTVRDATGTNLVAPVTLQQGARAHTPATCSAGP
ncbi:MAG: hypothetical protein Q8N13_22095 [Acidovorax sp.]|nr:hypothetical protein [Acidovorax sp.]